MMTAKAGIHGRISSRVSAVESTPCKLYKHHTGAYFVVVIAAAVHFQAILAQMLTVQVWTE
jgi:hypothetical protein